MATSRGLQYGGQTSCVSCTIALQMGTHHPPDSLFSARLDHRSQGVQLGPACLLAGKRSPPQGPDQAMYTKVPYAARGTVSAAHRPPPPHTFVSPVPAHDLEGTAALAESLSEHALHLSEPLLRRFHRHLRPLEAAGGARYEASKRVWLSKRAASLKGREVCMDCRCLQSGVRGWEFYVWPWPTTQWDLPTG